MQNLMGYAICSARRSKKKNFACALVSARDRVPLMARHEKDIETL